MNDVIVRSFAELHQALQKYRNDDAWVYRGHGDETWGLVPKAGREPYRRFDDREAFMAWKRRAVRLVEKTPANDFDWLELAQSYGLATRLLDWTFNPLTAAFFAVRTPLRQKNGVIFAYYSRAALDDPENDPFHCQGIVKIRPKGMIRRVVSQEGLFTVHNPPTLDLLQNLKPEERLERIVIDGVCKQELQLELSFYGVNTFSVFPDLEGLSSHINWYIQNRNPK